MHALSAAEMALLGGAGLAAGFVNTAAGAGSLLSLRALMLVGLGADVANATNRVPVLVQSVVAAASFDRAGQLERGQVLRVAAPSSAGALAGAVLASVIPEPAMRWVLIVVLLGIAFVGLRSTRRPAAAEGALRDPELALGPATIAWLFVAGAYGGFLQAGVGLVLLHALANVGGLDYARANALKVVTVAIFTLVALGVFVARGQVSWWPALVMSVGAALGARLGVKYAIAYAERLRVLVVVVDVLACAVLILREVAE